MKKNIYSILKGKFLISDDAFKNWRMILFISGLAIVMIASSHSADKKVHEIAKLNNEVKELRSAMIDGRGLSLIHISEPTRRTIPSRMPSSA